MSGSYWDDDGTTPAGEVEYDASGDALDLTMYLMGNQHTNDIAMAAVTACVTHGIKIESLIAEIARLNNRVDKLENEIAILSCDNGDCKL